MLKNIFKKFNSLELFKKILFIILNLNLKKNNKIFFNKFIKISFLLKNSYFYIYNGYKFIKIFFFFFFIGLPIGSFVFTKKPNKHLSFKKIKVKKR